MKKYSREISKGGILTGILFSLYVYFNFNQPLNELLIGSVYFLILYFLLFTIGQPAVSARIGQSLSAGNEKVVLFPAVLVIMLYFYLAFHGYSPFEGTAALFPFFFLFPLLGFLAFKKTEIVWSDFVFLLLLLVPAVSISFKNNTGVPIHGNSFGSVYKIVIMLMGVYAFGIVRGIKDVGFYPSLQLKSVGIAIDCWLAFIGIVLIIGYFGNFVNLAGLDPVSKESVASGIKNFIRIFIGTALFEELYFRGLIQNMLAQKIRQYAGWQKVWLWGSGIFTSLAFITGYLMDKSLFWFPVLISLILFGAAYFIEKSRRTSHHGIYTALAITSIFFGLVHFHAGSVIFVGLASVAGWFYGYTYLKTKNVFYAALVHTLVNSSEFLFALDGLK